MKTVTTIICHRNYQQYLPNAIESCINQTCKNYVVVVDDNSDDISSVEKIIGWQLGDAINRETFPDESFVETREKGIFISLRQTCGPSLARNIGMARTIGNTDYFAILDADDEMLPEKVEKCVDIIESNHFICGVYGDYWIINESGEKRYEHKKSYSKDSLERDCIIHSGSVIRKDSLLQVLENGNIYDPTLRTCEDYDLWLRLSNVGIFYHIPEPLTLVRVHNNNSTSSVSKEIWENNYRRVKQKYYEKCSQHTK